MEPQSVETTCTAFQLFSSCDSGSIDGQILTNAKHNVRVSGPPTWHKGTLGSFFPQHFQHIISHKRYRETIYQTHVPASLFKVTILHDKVNFSSMPSTLSRWFAFAETHFSFGFLVIGVAPSSLSTLPISLQCHSLFKWSDTWIWHLEGHWRWSDTWKDTWRPPGFCALSFSFQRQPLCHWDMIHCTVQLQPRRRCICAKPLLEYFRCHTHQWWHHLPSVANPELMLRLGASKFVVLDSGGLVVESVMDTKLGLMLVALLDSSVIIAPLYISPLYKCHIMHLAVLRPSSHKPGT